MIVESIIETASEIRRRLVKYGETDLGLFVNVSM